MMYISTFPHFLSFPLPLFSLSPGISESLVLFKVSSRKNSFFLADLTATDFSRDFKITDKILNSE